MAKNILFIGKFFFPALGGGEEYIKNAFIHLRSKGYNVSAVCFYDGTTLKPFAQQRLVDWDGIPVYQITTYSPSYVNQLYDDLKPDVVVSHGDLSPELISIAKSRGIKTIVGAHFYTEILAPKDGRYIDLLSRDEQTLDFPREKQQVFQVADRVYANSKYMESVMKKFMFLQPHDIIYPPININNVISSEENRTRITFVNPCIGKGLGIVYELAKRLPQYEFLIVGDLIDKSSENLQVYNGLKQLKNVSFTAQISRMKEVYGQTKLLLVPSLVDETFSMVTLEAMANGIPVVASNYGNLKFLAPYGGFSLPPDDLNSWTRCVTELMEDNKLYQSYSKSGKLAAADLFSSKSQCIKFERMVESLFGVTAIVDHYLPVIGGAEKSLHKNLSWLAQTGLKCSVICRLNSDGKPFERPHTLCVDGVEIHQIGTASIADLKSRMGTPDCIITMLTATPIATRIATESKIKVIHYIVDETVFSNRDIMQCIRSTTTKHIIANSPYTQRRLASHGIKSTVLMPAISEPIYPKTDGRYFLFADSRPHKGSELVLELARRLPNESFISLGKIEHAPSNLICLERVEDSATMSKLYSEAKAVLVPSQVAETFSMVAAEAILHKTPVIASDIGALPETVGKCGIIVHRVDSLDAWENALKYFLEHNFTFPFNERISYFRRHSDPQILIDIIRS